MTEAAITTDRSEELHDLERRIRDAWGDKPYIPRSAARDVTVGVYAPGTLANLDSRGQGPTPRYMLGKTTVYGTEGFINWFLQRVADPQPGKVGSAR